MKRLLIFAFLFALCVPVQARNIWDDFAANVSADNVRAFAKDLGGLMGSGTYTTGRVLGWGGFQIGPRASMIFKMSNGKNETTHTALGKREEVGCPDSQWVAGGGKVTRPGADKPGGAVVATPSRTAQAPRDDADDAHSPADTRKGECW